MNAVSRGMRNAFRNSIRTVSIVLILGISIGLALTMLVARQSVEDKIQSVKSSIGNTITISPAGARGFEGGGEALTSDQMTKLATLPNVTKVTQTLNDRLTTENTNLKSAIEPGSLGNRSGNNSGVAFQGPPPDQIQGRSGTAGGSSTQQITRTFTPPVQITGLSALDDPTSYGGNTVTYISGKAIDPTKTENISVIGKAIAEKNSLNVGSTFTAYGATITVSGIYDTGNTFANNGVIVSLPTLQKLSNQAGAVSSATVTVNSVDNIDSAVAATESTLGDKADVISNQENAKQTVEPLENVKTLSTYSLIGAIAAGAIIILLTMVMIVRERRREIGVMKAIGASNTKVMLQFVSEAITLTLLAMIMGIIISLAAASPITDTLVKNSTSNGTTTQQGPEGLRSNANGGRVFRNFGNNSAANIRNVQASVGSDILLYGFGAATIIAIVGSALPALMISKVRPSEVMRAD